MPRQMPLTFQQQWLLDLVQRHGDWNCVLAYSLRLSGQLNADVLQKSFDEIIRRHDSLRTKIVDADGIPAQQVDEPHAYRLEVTQVAGTTREQSAEAARRLVEEFSARTVDPAVGPLLNVMLLRLSEREHILVLTLHRLITDCFSVDEVFRDLWVLYPQLLRNQQPALPAPATQYGVYALWQRQAQVAWTEKHAAYWEERLAGAVPIRWPAEQLAHVKQRDAFGEMQSAFSAALSSGLRDLARRQRALAAMVMLSVYVAVVSRCCGQKDFVVPFNVAGRQSEHQHVIGYFSHVLYLRIQLTGDETFTGLLSHVSNEFFRALSHDDYGQMSLLRPELLAGTLFQWISGHPDEHAELPAPAVMESLGLDVTRLPIREFGGLTAIPPAILDVEISFFDTTEGIYASGVYRADRHSPDAMQRFLQDLHSAVEQFVCNPGMPVTSLASRQAA